MLSATNIFYALTGAVSILDTVFLDNFNSLFWEVAVHEAAICFSDLLAICQKPFMKHNDAFRNLFGKWQGKENFVRDSFVDQCWEILET